MPQTKLGAQKVNASALGLTLTEYQAKVAAGLKRCTQCKKWLPTTDFHRDRSRGDGLKSRCHDCANRRRPPVALRQRRIRNVPVGGDAEQARRLVNHQVENGERRHPNALPCSDCGHLHQPGERRHEYHHYLGYAPDHHNSVIPLCTTCHARVHHG